MSLEAQFEAMRLPELARIAVHEPAAVIARHETEVAKQFPAASPEWRHEHALARAHSLRHQAAVLAARSASPLVLSPPRRSFSWAWAWRLAVLAAVLFLCLRAASAQECGICIVKIQQGGSTVGTAAAPFTLNFGTNLAVSKTGSVYTLSASSTAATAWSAITPATNTNAGAFTLGNGTTLNYSGTGVVDANQYKGGAASGTGACAANQYVVTLNDGATPSCLAVTAAAVSSLPGTSGQLLFNNGGAIGAEDPVVSGHDATGTAPTANPVYVAGWDGTNVRPILTDTSGRVAVNVNGTVPVSGTFWQATQPVSLASLPALAAGSNTIGAISNTSFTANAGTGFPVVDPCQAQARSYAPINITASAQEITGTASKQTYICGFTVVASAADNVALVEGTGTTCGTATAGVIGGTTAATGLNLAANGGVVMGNGGFAVAKTATAADNVCLLVSGSAQVSGVVSYVQQ